MPTASHGWFLWLMCYLLGILTVHPRAHTRNVHIEEITNTAFLTSVLIIVVFSSYLWIDKYAHLEFWTNLGFSVLVF
ncbi:MAG: hypothetical protein J6P82_03290, partial [Bacteroidales bacterium]|nr:hypothetical protein [Bacteroidales bacterium]